MFTQRKYFKTSAVLVRLSGVPLAAYYILPGDVIALGIAFSPLGWLHEKEALQPTRNQQSGKVHCLLIALACLPGCWLLPAFPLPPATAI